MGAALATVITGKLLFNLVMILLFTVKLCAMPSIFSQAAICTAGCLFCFF
jgi:hypothetical protein